MLVELLKKNIFFALVCAALGSFGFLLLAPYAEGAIFPVLRGSAINVIYDENGAKMQFKLKKLRGCTPYATYLYDAQNREVARTVLASNRLPTEVAKGEEYTTSPWYLKGVTNIRSVSAEFTHYCHFGWFTITRVRFFP